MKTLLFPSIAAALAISTLLPVPVPAEVVQPSHAGDLLITSAGENEVPQGAACALNSTQVRAVIFGHVCETTLTQTFANPFDFPVEATYLFPLPDESAVDSMTMTIGDRHIVGVVKEKVEAQRIYEVAKSEGQAASILIQHTPNTFTQKAANIPPHGAVVVEISFQEILDYRDGEYTWVFPMAVGTITDGDATAYIQPRPAVSIDVDILAGTTLGEVKSELHDVTVDRSDERTARVSLVSSADRPNADFILHYRTGGDEIGNALFTQEDQRGRFFTMTIDPPHRVKPELMVPREIVFVIDASGSMNGFPLERAKETMSLCMETMGPEDTFNLIAFAGSTERCFDTLMPNTDENRATANAYLTRLHGDGGTEMAGAVEEALGGEHDPSRLRVVCFMTDGFIGYGYDLLGLVRQHAGTARVFSFGIGDSVNRFLLDGMAREGRGDVEYVTSETDAGEAAKRFLSRIQSPVLTDITVDWGGLQVADVVPARIPDLFDEKPLTIRGRIEGDAPIPGTINIGLSGNTGVGPRTVYTSIHPSHSNDLSAGVATLWARGRIGELTQDYHNNSDEDLRARIIALSTGFQVMSEFTSFVAVEEKLEGNDAMLALPATATRDALQLIAGMLAMLIGTLWVIVRGVPAGKQVRE